MSAIAEALVRVAIPSPSSSCERKRRRDEGEAVTLAWKTKNARRVRFAERSSFLSAPHGKMRIKPDHSYTYTVQAENGEKSTRKSLPAKVLDPEFEQQRIAKEKI